MEGDIESLPKHKRVSSGFPTMAMLLGLVGLSGVTPPVATVKLRMP